MRQIVIKEMHNGFLVEADMAMINLYREGPGNTWFYVFSSTEKLLTWLNENMPKIEEESNFLTS